MSTLPEEVNQVKENLVQRPHDECAGIGLKLLRETPELEAMWKALERRKRPSDPERYWVWAFLTAALKASTLPNFHYKSASERRRLAESIEAMATQLADALVKNDLDVHLVYTNGAVWNGFYVYEDFSDANQSRIDDQIKGKTVDKLSVALMIKNMGDRVRERLANEPAPGKAGTNVKAIRFVRLMAERNAIFFGEPLNAVLATAANAIFDTSYQESDIRNLLNR